MTSRNMKKNAGALAFILLLLLWGYFFGFGDIMAKKNLIQYSVNKENLYRDVESLSTVEPPRNVYNIQTLNIVAEYIKKRFGESGCEARFQSFNMSGETGEERAFHNVECLIMPEDVALKNKPAIIIGAHYDVAGYNPGADDNASGVAGLLEIARLVKSEKLKLTRPLRIVAFTIEEPPIFATEDMGSVRYINYLKENGIAVEFMINFEMIGYFTDEKRSQKYPSPLMHLFYPSRGNFIALVGEWGDRKFTKRIRDHMRGASKVKIRSLNAPANLAGVDFSDHRSFWHGGYKALMVTDTSFYRNPHYHEKSDTIDILDFDKMAQVVGSIFHIIKMEGVKQKGK